MFRRTSTIISCLALAAAIGACGHDDDEGLEVRDDLAKLGGKADAPDWMRHIPVNWGCGETLKGKFKGPDSAHLYSFGAKAGYRYTFSFEAQYRYGFGAVIAIYEADTGKRVAIARRFIRSKASITYTADRSVKYLVAVYSISWFARGEYTLKAECELTGFCVEWEAVDPSGAPLRNFYAVNVKTYGEGKQLLAQFKHFSNEDIRPGTCAAQDQMCGRFYQPVCADTPKAKTEYGNVCELKVHIRQQAGATDQWKGHWEPGKCGPQFCGGIAGLPCPVGQKCVITDSYPDAGGSCQNIVCSSDGKDYVEGESFPSDDGCNTCTCTAGLMRCTKRACPPLPSCDPKKEWYRRYISTEAATCQVIKFSCPENTNYFGNACGCGCEQDASCPEWVNCMPPAPCDEAAIKKKCPFTEIAW